VTLLRGSSLRPLPPVASKDPNTRYATKDIFDCIDPAKFGWLEDAVRLCAVRFLRRSTGQCRRSPRLTASERQERRGGRRW